MSDVPGMQSGQPDQPSEEQLRAALMEMRNAPIDAMAAQVLQLLLEGVQIKLGRQDARILLDLTGTVIEQLRPHLDAGLTGQVDNALHQLRLAQVDAEQQVAADPQPEPNDLGGPADAATQPSAPSPGQTPPQTPPATPPSGGAGSRLWTPGS